MAVLEVVTMVLDSTSDNDTGDRVKMCDTPALTFSLLILSGHCLNLAGSTWLTPDR